MEVGALDKSVGMIVQARMSSTRMPGKVLMPMPFGSHDTMLSTIVKSLNVTGAKIVIATSTNAENDAIEKFCLERGLTCFRGSEKDVFSRFLTIQKAEQFQVVMRFTADNPFIDIKKLFEFYLRFLELEVEYSYSVGMPIGMNFEIMKGSVIHKLGTMKLDRLEREHVTLRLRDDNDQFKVIPITLAHNSNMRMTVDTPLDYVQASTIKTVLGNEISLTNIIRISQIYPWLTSLNSETTQVKL